MIKTYVNKSGARKIVTKKRMKMWLNPGQEIELDDIDVRALKANAAHIVVKDEGEPVAKAAPAPKAEAPAPTAPASNDAEGHIV